MERPDRISAAAVSMAEDWPPSALVGAFIKHNTRRRPYCVANEYLAYRLGAATGLPMAPGRLARHPSTPGSLAWYSVRPTPAEAWEPADPCAVVAVDPEQSAGILAFDVFILNPDRHPGNLSYSATSWPHVRLFDHASALFGEVAGGATARIAASDGDLGVQSATAGSEHCLIDRVDSLDALLAWASRLGSSLPDRLVTDELERTARLGLGPTEQEARCMAAFLARRRDRLAELLYRHRRRFLAISDAAWAQSGLVR